MTFVFSGFSFILHLAHHLASLSRSRCRYSAAKSIFLLTAHWPAICLDRSDLTCTCFSGRFSVQSCRRAAYIAMFVTRETICSAVKLNVLLGVVVKLVLGLRSMKLVLDHMLPEGLILVSRTAFVVGDMRSPTITTFWFPFFFVRTVFMRMCFTIHNTFWFFGVVWCLVPKTLHLKHCWIEGVVLNSSALKIITVLWHINPPPEISASACFGLSHFILRKGRSLPDLLDVILSASAWVILLNSSSSLKSSIVTFVDTPLNAKIFPFVGSAE